MEVFLTLVGVLEVNGVGQVDVGEVRMGRHAKSNRFWKSDQTELATQSLMTGWVFDF